MAISIQLLGAISILMREPCLLLCVLNLPFLISWPFPLYIMQVPVYSIMYYKVVYLLYLESHCSFKEIKTFILKQYTIKYNLF